MYFKQKIDMKRNTLFNWTINIHYRIELWGALSKVQSNSSNAETVLKLNLNAIDY